MKHLPIALLATALLSGCALTTHNIQLTANGNPAAEIIVAHDAHPAVHYAAQELQYWIKAISGAELKIADKPTGNANTIRLAVKPDGFVEDIKAIGESDGCAVRPEAGRNGIIVLGTRPKGVLNGVYKLLFRNTDIIWARPDKDCGTVFSPNANISLTDTDFRDIPVYVLRGWQIVSRNDANLLWQNRNCMNWMSVTNTFSPKTEIYDPVREFGGGHNLCGRYITEKKYYDAHPDFFPLVKGQRVRPSAHRLRCQLCFSNKNMTRAFIEEIDRNVKECPNYDTYRIMIEDNYILCECDDCLKTITLPDGSKLTKDDKAFRSTQFFQWLNPIARHIKDKYGKRVLTFAYFFTEIPPKCNVEDNISISFCPIGKNSKHTVLEPENVPTKEKLDGWLAVTPNVTWREYYGLCGAFPRPIDVIAAEDLKYANKHGVTRTYSEMYSDATVKEKTESWDVNAMYFWCLAQLVWNPNANVMDLRKTFLKRVFGTAADDLEQFYSIIENSWFNSPGISTYRDKIRGNWVTYVVRAGKTDLCRHALDRAAEKQLSPKATEMLRRIRAVFDQNTKDIVLETMSSSKITEPPRFDPLFTSAPWNNTQMSDNFLLNNGKKQSPATQVRILHDDKALYVGILCPNNDFDKLGTTPQMLPRDTWPAGDKIETFFTGLDERGNITSIQIVITPNGDIYDSRGMMAKWNGDFDVKTEKRKDGWSLMLTIPYKTLGFDKLPNDFKTSYMRYLTAADGKTQVSYWNEMAPHSLANYTDLILK